MILDFQTEFRNHSRKFRFATREIFAFVTASVVAMLIVGPICGFQMSEMRCYFCLQFFVATYFARAARFDAGSHGYCAARTFSFRRFVSFHNRGGFAAILGGSVVLVSFSRGNGFVAGFVPFGALGAASPIVARVRGRI